MAKGKSGGTKGLVSAGIHSGSKASVLNNIRREFRQSGDYMLNLQSCHRKGQNPWVAIDNPNKEKTAQRTIRVRANELWGNPKDRGVYVMKGMVGVGE